MATDGTSDKVSCRCSETTSRNHVAKATSDAAPMVTGNSEGKESRSFGALSFVSAGRSNASSLSFGRPVAGWTGLGGADRRGFLEHFFFALESKDLKC